MKEIRHALVFCGYCWWLDQRIVSIPVLWKVSKLTRNEGPTSKEAIGRGIAGPTMGAAGNLPFAVVRVGLERRRPTPTC